MTLPDNLWSRFDGRARSGLIMGAVLIIIGTIALGIWVFRTDYQVLFADLAAQDAATMVTELERMKIPYRLSGGGNTILVPADVVYKTRLKLVGKELPLHGAVGFELFSESEVGMTEFAQKVNYQRALQGELTRTILSLDEVQSARVHLVLSEQALFKKKGTQPKASISIVPKPGKTLDASQVQGIQRLVAAAVPDIKANDVTIVDQHGVAMTRRSGDEGEETTATSDGLDEKRAIEAYLNKKVVEVLDRTYGSGQGIASVDVTLGHEHTKVTTENVLGSNPDQQGRATGTVIHERQTARDPNSGDILQNPVAVEGNNSLISREVNYQVGRRVEQVVSRSGAISHINVAVVVRKTLNQAQLDRLRDLVASATGINKARGDAVAVYSVDQITSAVASPTALATSIPDSSEIVSSAPDSSETNKAVTTPQPLSWEIALAGMLALALLVFLWRGAAKRVEPRTLSSQERDRLLAQVRDWLESSPRQPMERS